MVLAFFDFALKYLKQTLRTEALKPKVIKTKKMLLNARFLYYYNLAAKCLSYRLKVSTYKQKKFI